jgi:hypothetical protein
LAELFSLFYSNLLPIFLATGAGYLLAHRLKVPVRPLSQAAFYIFSPCLIFSIILSSNINAEDAGLMVLFTLVISLLMGLLSWITGRLLRLDRKEAISIALPTMFTNAGNYGLALVLFAFGEEALAFAAIFFVTNALLAYSLGAVTASLGSRNLTDSLKGLFRVPALYAMILGLVISSLGWKLPLPVDRAVNLLADASIPVLMVVLGMQLQAVKWQASRKTILAVTILRLGIAPLVAFWLSGILGMEGPMLQAAVLEASMPSAILNTVLATEYNLQPTLVTAAVFMTTLLSPLTLTPLLAILGG